MNRKLNWKLLIVISIAWLNSIDVKACVCCGRCRSLSVDFSIGCTNNICCKPGSSAINVAFDGTVSHSSGLTPYYMLRIHRLGDDPGKYVYNNYYFSGPDVTLSFTEPGEYTVEYVVELRPDAETICCFKTVTKKFSIVSAAASAATIDLEYKNTTQNCATGTVEFEALKGYTVLDPAIAYEWDFGDGTTTNSSSGNRKYTHTYTQTGSYQVCLDMTGGSCSTATSKCTTICVQVKCPQASFSKSHASGNIRQVTFNAVPFTGATYYWEFGDGTTLTTSNPQCSTTYAAEGVYDVKLKVSTACTSRTTTKKICAQTLNATFSKSVNSTTRVVTFTGPSNPGAEYYWDFGDGATSTVQSPTHTYPKDGFYTATLSVLKKPCLSAFYSDNICLNTMDADFSFEVFNNRLVQFTVPNQYNATYSWNFGHAAPNNTSAVQNPSHIFPTAGSYSCTLTVSGTCSSKTVIKTVCVDKAEAYFTYALQNISGTPNKVRATFNALSQPGKLYSWNFGDGNTSTLQNPIHDYTLAGNRTVTFTVSDPSPPGCATATMQKTLCVSLPITASFTPSANFTCEGGTLTFTNSSTGGGVEYAWYLDDVLISRSATTAAVTFTQPGTHTIKLIARSGCTNEVITAGSTATVPITVHPKNVNAGFTYSQRGTTVKLNAVTSPSTLSPTYSWALTNTTTQTVYNFTGQSVTTSTLPPGRYSACLTIADSCWSEQVCKPLCISDGIVDCCATCGSTQ